MNIKLFLATKAFIKHRGKILIIKESSNYQEGTNAGKFDVPGGRIKPGQNFAESLLREIKEETGLEVKIGQPFFVNEWRPIVKDEPWQVIGIFFKCTTETDKVILSQDHDEYLWIDPADFKKYNLIENLTPAFEAYLKK
ncbi:MAG: NUDIX domain-containing protein [Candidatus Komeilibacteria bacterium]|nr:NUDIX domain-containing protein [Candidatus Komeilibacteria bacterium]